MRIRGAARHVLALIAVAALAVGLAEPLSAQGASYRQALAAATEGDAALARFYRARDFDPVWTGRGDGDRREALLEALSNAGGHALPERRFAPDSLATAFRSARSDAALARVEAEASRLFLDYAHAVQSGVLEPNSVVSGIKRDAPRRDGAALLDAFAQSTPAAFLDVLPPQSREYARLRNAKARLETVVGRGGWGPGVEGGTLEPGASGARVTALRRRLAAQGYEAGGGASYGRSLQTAVARFQADHGLSRDGVAGPATLRALNVSAGRRLAQVVTAMERERWLNRRRGDRHIRVNITDYSVRILEEGRVLMRTRAVVGAPEPDRRTPEFSDVMNHMVVNPSWYVPNSITTQEYLPRLKADSSALARMQLRDSNGNPVDRSSVDFGQYTQENFPYRLVEPPSTRNALGRVKFMFPNRYNIYLHDTPATHLFSRSARAFSHGCVRLNDPFEFAYTLLAPQSRQPEALFRRHLESGEETRVDLADPVPVHITYRTAFTGAEGDIQYRDDVYGRDAAIFDALQSAGVVLRARRG